MYTGQAGTELKIKLTQRGKGHRLLRARPVLTIRIRKCGALKADHSQSTSPRFKNTKGFESPQR